MDRWPPHKVWCNDETRRKTGFPSCSFLWISGLSCVSRRGSPCYENGKQIRNLSKLERFPQKKRETNNLLRVVESFPVPGARWTLIRKYKNGVFSLYVSCEQFIIRGDGWGKQKERKKWKESRSKKRSKRFCLPLFLMPFSQIIFYNVGELWTVPPDLYHYAF